MTTDLRARLRSALRNELPRLTTRRAGLEELLREAMDRKESDPLRLGLELAAQYPELAGIATVLAAPDQLQLAAEDARTPPDVVRATEEVARLISGSPRLLDALYSAFPHRASPPEPASLVVLVADPLVDEDGKPLQRLGWRIPWTRLADGLAETLRRTGRAFRLEVGPATFERAMEWIPRARFLLLLSHGSEEGLAFEDSHSLRGRRHVLSIDADLPKMFQGKLPEVVLVLACHGGAAAEAIHRAGVPVAVGIDEADRLSFTEAVTLASSFFGALAAGQSLAVALDQAGHAAAPGRVRRFGSTAGAVLPPGDVVLGEADRWINLPPREVFVGRERELSELFARLEGSGSIVQVIGAPGIGKTELARAALARARLYRWPSGGSAFIELERVTTPDALVRAAATALSGVSLPDPSPKTVGRILGLEERLLVLDNAEDPLSTQEGRSALQELVQAVLSSGRARLLITSREPLHWAVRGPSPLKLSGLASDAETVAALEGALRHSFVEADRMADERWYGVRADPDFEDLIRALDRYALAIMLAGAQLADGAPVSRVLVCLKSEGDLRHPGVDPEEAGRLESLARSLDLSRERLRARRPSAEELWRIIADLPGGIPSDCALEPEDDEDLRQLRRFDLIEDWAGGYQCLGPMRDYLAKHVAAAASPQRTARVRVVAVQALASRLESIQGALGTVVTPIALALLGRWHLAVDHLLAEAEPAWAARAGDATPRLATAAAEIAVYAGLPQLAWRWVNAHTVSGRETPDLLLVTARVAEYISKNREARLAAERALASFQAIGNRLGEANTLHILGNLDLREARLAQAKQRCVGALAAYQAIGNRLGEANTLKSLGDLDVREARLAEARQRYDRALASFQAIGDRLGVANTLMSLGDVDLREGSPPEARQHYERALALFRAVRERLGEANTLRSLGDVDLREARLAEARQRYDRALASFQAIGDRLGEAAALHSLGNLALREDRLAEARQQLERALASFQAIRNSLGEANTLMSLGDLHLREDRLPEARQNFERALVLSQAIGDLLGETNSLKSLGDLDVREARLADAQQRYERALASYQAIGDRLGEANILQGLGDLDLREDRLAEAQERYERALALFRAGGALLGEANTLRSLGDVDLREGSPPEARQHYERALALYQAMRNRLGEANTLKSLGDLDQQEDRLAEARQRYDRALASFRAVRERLGEANTLRSLGDVDLREGSPPEARQHYERALAAFQGIGEHLGEANAVRSLAMLALRESALNEAVERGHQAAGLSLAIGDRLGASGAFGIIGRAHMAAKEPADALAALLKAWNLAREAGSRFNEALSLLDIAAALDAKDQTDAAKLVAAAGAVLGLRIGLGLSEEMRSVARKIEAEGMTEGLLEKANRFLDGLTTVAQPPGETA